MGHAGQAHDTESAAGEVSRHVLVVDDDDDIREVASMALSVVGGLRVSTAVSGREALRLAAEKSPDAILLDVMMPDMDGPTTVAMLKREIPTQNIPIILLTAKVQAHDPALLGDIDVSGVIAKPFDPMTLAGQVADLLGWPQ